jgi:hypothetical protein
MSSNFLTTHFFTSAASASVNCMVKIVFEQFQTVRVELRRTDNVKVVMIAGMSI